MTSLAEQLASVRRELLAQKEVNKKIEKELQSQKEVNCNLKKEIEKDRQSQKEVNETVFGYIGLTHKLYVCTNLLLSSAENSASRT
jgi:hypothetical protein